MNNLFKSIAKNKWYLFMIIIGILIIIKGVYTYSQYKDFLQSPLIINGASIEYKIKPGASMRKIAKDLTRKGLLEHPTYLIVRARMRKLAQSIKVGEYVIRQGTFPDELLDQFVKGKVKQYALTIIEGWNFREVMKAVNKHPDLRHTLAGKADAEIMKAIGYEGMHPEGRFYPDTYRFPAMTTDVEFLKRAYRHMEKILDQAWENKADKLPLTTPYQALILASIIEKETAQKSEYREIAGVFTRRLIKKIRLQTDPTVIYGLGDKFNGNLRRKHLRRDTPYNTYTRRGLPPTPIAMPGIGAIKAALNPADGKTLYFVAKGNGRHYFSKTLKEHNEAVIRYQLNGDRTRVFSSRPVADKK